MNIIVTVSNFVRDFYIQRRFIGGGIKSNIPGVNDVGNSDYYSLRFIFKNLFSIQKDDIIADIGCGKGRFINYLLLKGYKNKIYGYEINKSVANETRNALKRFKQVEIIDQNIFSNFPQDATVFYIFNSFQDEMIISLIEHFKRSPQAKTILYFYPVYLSYFQLDSQLEVQSFKIPHSWDLAIISKSKSI